MTIIQDGQFYIMRNGYNNGKNKNKNTFFTLSFSREEAIALFFLKIAK